MSELLQALERLEAESLRPVSEWRGPTEDAKRSEDVKRLLELIREVVK